MAQQYKIHPFATAFPYMTDEEVEKLAEDIKVNGQIHPIIVMGDVLLDGRHRQRACRMAGIEPIIKEYEGPTDEESLLRFITSLNIHRRHLTPSQKSYVGLKMMLVLSAEAKERQRQAGMVTQFSGKNEDGTPKLRVVPNLEQPEESYKHAENTEETEQSKTTDMRLFQTGAQPDESVQHDDNTGDTEQAKPTMEKGRAIEIAANAVGVSKQYIHDARKIEESHPEKAREIEAGKKTLSQAKKEIEQEKKAQEQKPSIEEEKKDPPQLILTLPKKGTGLQDLICFVDKIQNDESLPEEVPVLYVHGKALGYELQGVEA